MVKIQKNQGMTYVEIIVVLGIFSVMSAIVMFNYGEFQAKVDIKNLASDIALKIVEAQKSALSGNLPPGALSDWKPSYGVHFYPTFGSGSDNKHFIYFSNLNNDQAYGPDDGLPETISIGKGNYISGIYKCEVGSSCSQIASSLSIVFTRPDSSAVFSDISITGSKYVQITVQSPRNANAIIKIYPSGRIQVN